MKAVVHYHEIGLKGKNRGFFVRTLKENLRRALAPLGRTRVKALYGRLLVESDAEEAVVLRRIGEMSGVAYCSPAVELPQAMEAVEEEAWRQVQVTGARTFAIRCRRVDKEFPLDSRTIERRVGAYVLGQAARSGRELRVDLSAPEVTVRIHLVNRRALVTGAKHPGPGGLPVGSGGRVVALLSAGFDSPVASWQVMNRGAEVVFCHFHAYPYTGRAGIDNARGLVEVLTRYQLSSRLYLVGFAPVQQEIMALVPAELRLVVYRRSMMRIAQEVARREEAEALVTGESLGQVASQTLTNLAVIDQAADLPVLRPLVGTDKQEIVHRAERLGTAAISSRPYEDCCSLMVARHPSTHAKLTDVLRLESAMDLADLERRAVEEAEVEDYAWLGPGRVERQAAGL